MKKYSRKAGGGFMTRLTMGVATAVASVFVAFWLIWSNYSIPIAFWAMGTGASIQDAGSWGDTFGPYSALTGAIGFALVFATLVQQIIVTKQQQFDQHKQRFEATYFELLGMLRAARSEVRFRQSDEYRSRKKLAKVKKAVEGPAAFRSAMFEFRMWLEDEGHIDDRKEAEKRLGELYRKRVHVRYESTFGPYFRLLYTILWRLNEDKKIEPEERRRYGNLLRAHLTSFEIGLAGFNGLMDQAKNFDELLTEFRMLKYYPSGTVRRALESVYLPKAFEGSDKTPEPEEILEVDPLDEQSDTD